MFTGLVETKGVLAGRSPRGEGARLRIDTHLRPLVLGESIAVQGVCLTVDQILDRGFQCDASPETLTRSTLGRIRSGSLVHLERAVPLGGRMGGHIVSGHVDDRIRVREKARLGEAVKLEFQTNLVALRFIAPKGSVAVDGVSLTVNDVSADGFDVVVVPHTLRSTSLGDFAVGQEANLEVDMLARYVARLLETPPNSAPSAPRDESLVAKLKAAGYL